MLFNRARAEEHMRRCGLEALVAASPVNITYFSGYYCWMDGLLKEYMVAPGGSSDLLQAYALFPLEGEPALVISPLMAINAADGWVTDLRTYGSAGLDTALPPGSFDGLPAHLPALLAQAPRAATATQALLGALHDCGLRGARIGVDMEGLTARGRQELAAALPANAMLDCSNLIRIIRAVKSGEEIARLTRAAEINEQVGLQALRAAAPGVAVGELARHFKQALAAQDADFDHFAFSMRGLGIATEPAYTLRADDVLYVDWGCLHQRYFADTGLTLALRDVTEPAPLRERHAALAASVAAGAQAMRPGAPASSVRAAMRQAFEAAGFSASYPHGHGLGLELRDYPIVVEDNGLRIKDDCIDLPSDLPLEAGMVINLEAGMFLPGLGAAQAEKTFLVTPEGCRPLIPQERATPFVP